MVYQGYASLDTLLLLPSTKFFRGACIKNRNLLSAFTKLSQPKFYVYLHQELWSFTAYMAYSKVEVYYAISRLFLLSDHYYIFLISINLFIFLIV